MLHFFHTAYNVASSVESVLIESNATIKNDLIVPVNGFKLPDVEPWARMRSDLGFDDSLYTILRGTLTHVVPTKGFYKCITPKDVVEFLKLKDKQIVNVVFKKLDGSSSEAPFIKKVSKSGSGFVL